ncbi:zinc finger protein CONSTANS-like 4-like [Trifolium pratense]|uniref:Zinc finger protein CONSTANS-like 4-like n=1 Tax=Trifolium pratense TaxID=57577 RepID=A0A2K3NUE3_TRIPR|nr:zinc finger protein CONSTANS-like 4-like [Trifolium pratense]
MNHSLSHYVLFKSRSKFFSDFEAIPFVDLDYGAIKHKKDGIVPVLSSTMKVVFVLDGNLMSEIPNCGYGKAVMMDQEARVLRYKEKRKNRRFEKTIHGSLFFQFLHSHSNEDPPSTITLVLAGSSSLLFTGIVKKL